MVWEEDRKDSKEVIEFRGAGMGILDYYYCDKTRICEKIWNIERIMKKSIMALSEPKTVTCKCQYEDKLNQCWERVSGK